MDFEGAKSIKLDWEQMKSCAEVQDSSVDYKGHLPLRSSTGAWKAALFVVAMELSERLSYFGLATNLIIYLMHELHQDLKTAARNVNYWQGVTTLMPLLGGFLADAYLGRFSAVVCSTLVYLAGLILLALSRLVPSLTPCDKVPCQKARTVHEIIFFMAIYLVSVGTGGHKPSLESFGADQFDEGHAAERKQKMSYFNWWNCFLCVGVMLGVTVIAYIEDTVSWAAADIVLICVMGSALVVFLAGRRVYRYRVPQGSPLTPMLQVAVAAVRKRHLPHPSSAAELYEVTESAGITNITQRKRLLSHTNKLKVLDKAAIVEDTENAVNPWRLVTVTQVEETKLILAMIPIWLACLPFGICVAQVTTLFIKQASTMNRKLSLHFELPPASIFSLSAIGMIIAVVLYEKVLVPLLRRVTGSERGISILRRIGIGMALATVAMGVAAAVERRRLNSVPSGSTLSVFWLVPQFLIMGFGDGFALVGLQEYFYEQVPDSMRSLGIAFYLSVIGAGNFVSSMLITVVDHLSQQVGKGKGKGGWFAKDLNASRLDLFYALLVGISTLNLCWYAYLASRYSYKTVQVRVGTAYSDGDQDDVESQAR